MVTGPMEKINAPLGSGRAQGVTPRARTLEASTTAQVAAWLDAHPRARVSWSGGKDSTLALYFARLIRPDIPVCWFHSGLEFPQNERYILRLAEQWDLNLHIYPAEPDALTVFVNTGSWDEHAVTVPAEDLMDALIERPSKAANDEHGTAVIYGLRADESRNRRALLTPRKGVVERHDKHGNLTEEYLAPVWAWSERDLLGYMNAKGIPLNPLYKLMTDLQMPEKRRRVGPLINASLLDNGTWVYSRMLAPDLCRQVEARLPRLAEFR